MNKRNRKLKRYKTSKFKSKECKFVVNTFVKTLMWLPWLDFEKLQVVSNYTFNV